MSNFHYYEKMAKNGFGLSCLLIFILHQTQAVRLHLTLLPYSTKYRNDPYDSTDFVPSPIAPSYGKIPRLRFMVGKRVDPHSANDDWINRFQRFAMRGNVATRLGGKITLFYY